MKKWLRIPAALAALSMVVSLAACSGGGGENSPAATEPAASADSGAGASPVASEMDAWAASVKESLGGTKITVAMASHPSTEAFRAMAAGFTEKTGIEILWDVVEETNLKTKQMMDAQGAGSYDVFMVDAFWMNEYATKNLVEPVTTFVDNPDMTPEWFDYEDIMPAYRNGIAAAGGENYGIPTAGETRFIAYRTDLFEKHQKEPPKTMDEFLELAQYFNENEDGVYGVSMRGQRGIHFASGWMSLMYNFGGGFMDQTTFEMTANTPETVQSLQFYVDLLGCAPPDVGTYTHEEALGAFISGKTAMWLDATALANQITDPDVSTVADKVAFVSTPTGPAGDGAALAGWNLSIPVSSKNKEAAWAFVVYMAGKPNSVQYVKNGGVATRNSVYENQELIDLNPSYPAQKEALISANGLVEKGLSWIPQHDKINQILDIAGNYGSRALAGEIDVQSACDSIQKDGTAELAN